MDYPSVVEYIWGLVNYETNPPQSGDAYSLDRMHQLLKVLGNPQDNVKFIHVAGTKGKGSTTTYLESIIRAQGYKTGSYISPHMYSPRERISISGVPVSKEDFVELAEMVIDVTGNMKELTSFEFLTAMAFLKYSSAKVDFVVLEVGLGGRLDATNTITSALASVITPVSFDHARILCSTLDKIAFEKAGIIKPLVPVIISKQIKIAETSIVKIAEEKKSPYFLVDNIVSLNRTEQSLEGQVFDLKFNEGFLLNKPNKNLQDLFVPLLGFHQIENAATAIFTMHALSDQIRWSEEKLRDGLMNVRWPGRTEVVSRSPFVMIDGAHNDASARALSRTLRELQEAKAVLWDNLVLVLGVSGDKSPSAILQPLLHLVDNLIITQANHPRAARVSQIHEQIVGEFQSSTLASLPAIDECAQLSDAISMALSIAGKNGAVVFAGSLFLAAEARQAFINDFSD